MSSIIVRSFVKINLSIDVGKVADNGYHPVDMVMQQLAFHDDVTVEYMPIVPGHPETGESASYDGGSLIRRRNSWQGATLKRLMARC